MIVNVSLVVERTLGLSDSTLMETLSNGRGTKSLVELALMKLSLESWTLTAIE